MAKSGEKTKDPNEIRDEILSLLQGQDFGAAMAALTNVSAFVIVSCFVKDGDEAVQDLFCKQLRKNITEYRNILKQGE